LFLIWSTRQQCGEQGARGGLIQSFPPHYATKFPGRHPTLIIDSRAAIINSRAVLEQLLVNLSV